MTREASIEVRELRDKKTRRDWLTVPQTVMGNDKAWVRPLDIAELQRISPKHNAFFAFGDAAFFVAYKVGVPVGRISAHVHRMHLDPHQDGTGH